MNKLLFYDIYNLIKDVVNTKSFTKDLFFLYLVGYYSSSDSLVKMDSEQITNDYFKKNKYLHTIFKDQYSQIYKLNQSLKLEDLIRSIPCNLSFNVFMNRLLSKGNDILTIYNNYNIPIPQNIDTKHLLLKLFTECIEERPTTLFASYRNQKLKPNTINSTFGRRKDAIKLKSILKQYHKIIISGQIGSGKTHFIKYCLSTWDLKDYCYIIYDTNITNTLNKIKFNSANDNIFSSKYLTDPHFSSALLVIDNMYNKQNISDELEELSKYSINIIVITIHNINVDVFHSFRLSILSDHTLQKIFENNTKIFLRNKHIKGKLLRTTQKNIYMLSLIIGLCKKVSSELPKTNNSTDILTQILSRLEILDSHIDPILNNNDATNHYMEYTPELTSRFKVHYDQKTLDLIGHFKVIYKNIYSCLDENCQELLKYLCCFGWYPVPYTFLKIILPSLKEETIITLSKINLLSYINKTIQLPSLIAHSVVAVEMPAPSDYDILVNNITKFLKDYDSTLSVPYLSIILSVFAHTLYDNVRAENYTQESSKIESAEKRKTLLYMIHNYYNQTGDYVLATNMIDLMKHINLKSVFNSIDMQLFHFSNDLQIDATSKTFLPVQIDKIIECIINNKEPYNPIDITNFLINVLDFIIGSYCTLFYSLLSGQNNLQNYQNNLINVMNQILKYITAQPNDAKISIDIEKLEYYKLCNNLMKNEYPNSEELNNYLLHIKKWQNTNYRIRGIAFILFMKSFYVYCQTFTNLYQQNPDTLQSLLELEFIPEILYMSDLIRKCELIPIQTFKLCYYSYISTAMLQYCFLSLDYIDKQRIPQLFNSNNIQELLNRTILSKEDLDTAMTYINQIPFLT